MPQTTFGITAALVAALVAAPRPAAAPHVEAAPALACAAAADRQDARPPCCFANARYVGTCEVQPAGDETCATILDYLNNPQSQGKAYCASTTIRGGWQQTSCGTKAKPD